MTILYGQLKRGMWMLLIISGLVNLPIIIGIYCNSYCFLEQVAKKWLHL